MPNAISDEELRTRFAPVFDTIAGGAIARERDRALAFGAVTELREAGFGRLRVPRSAGGLGASIPQLFRLLVALAEADSNLPQILRAHSAFVEGRLRAPAGEQRTRWLRLVAEGALFGAAMAERTGATETTVRLTRRASGGWRLDGTKYYSTGTIYASWIAAVARDGDDRVLLATPADAAGVTILDDWDGFGQRLTGSGTTRFVDVHVDDNWLLRRLPQGEPPGDGYLTAFYQLFHIAALAGIARAVLRDATAYVQGKTRTFGVPGQSSPRHDPLVQRVIGRLSAIAGTSTALVDAVSGAIDRVSRVRDSEADAGARFTAVDIEAFEAQQIAIALVLEATTLMFEVGGASATAIALAFDRHWRNARVLASHNPATQRERAIGDYRLNGTEPSSNWTNAAGARAQVKDGATSDA